MARYIDLDDNEIIYCGNDGEYERYNIPTDAPTADVVECNRGEWIPCSERIPEYGMEVLTYNRDDEYEINHIIDEDDREWFFDGAVAWMPLPKPYKEGANNGEIH